MSCFIVKEPTVPVGGGGNARAQHWVSIRRNAALGDVLSSTVVADKLIDMGYQIAYQSHPDTHCILRRHGRIAKIGTPEGFVHVNLDGAYEKDAGRKRKHFHTMWFERTNEQLARFGICIGPAVNCRPRIRVRANDKLAIAATLQKYERPWVFVCPRSDSYNVRQVPDYIWREAAAQMIGTKFWIGRYPAPPNFIDLQCRHFDRVIDNLSCADLLVSVDTGPMHVAAALGVPVVAVGQSSSPELHLSDQTDFVTVYPMVDGRNLDCLNCQLNLCPKNQHIPPCQNVAPEIISSAANARLHMITTDDITAVIAIYQPRADILNQCLRSVIDQVQEIVVSCEGRSIIPAGALMDGKIKYVRTQKQGIGYSGNANFGARHANGRYLLMLNDDRASAW